MKVKLLGLDLDGTVLDDEKKLSMENRDAIAAALDQGVEVVIATGRPFSGLDSKVKAIQGIRYAVTGNGAAVYRLDSGECMFEEIMDPGLVMELFEQFEKMDILISVFVDGDGYDDERKADILHDAGIPEAIRNYIFSTRKQIADLKGFLNSRRGSVQKINLIFRRDPDGQLAGREAAINILKHYTDLVYVSGGIGNLEITMKSATKGQALLKLAEYLNIEQEAVMTCGDSENDLDMIEKAAIGIAMENGEDMVKEAADDMVPSNDENGVAYAIRKYILTE